MSLDYRPSVGFKKLYRIIILLRGYSQKCYYKYNYVRITTSNRILLLLQNAYD